MTEQVEGDRGDGPSAGDGVPDDEPSPSVAGPPDAHEGFHLTDWLDHEPTADGSAEAAGGDATTDSATAPTEGAPAPAEAEYEGFSFADWLADGDGELALLDDEPAVPAVTVEDAPQSVYVRPVSRGPDAHPMRIAAMALFVTAATLTLLTVGGVLPPLGPVTGLTA